MSAPANGGGGGGGGQTSASNILNVNVGVLGHVDSGKTSLVKALSTHLSTAALDKHPQSRERGITLDLGFSSFHLQVPESFRASHPKETAKLEAIQVTLVDCPGHASLIRTIIGGAQIIDLVILVIDVTRGIQAQTAECVILAEITTSEMIIVLNKVDLLPSDDYERRLESTKQSIRKALQSSKFANAPMVPTAAAVGGEKVAAPILRTGRGVGHEGGTRSTNGEETGGGGERAASDGVGSSCGVVGIQDLQRVLLETIRYPTRTGEGPLFFAIDHSFPIKGQGTVLTGTVLGGRVSVGDLIELPELGQQRKVKSLQMFHQAVKSARQGDRLGLCVTNLDAKALERGLATSPGSVRPITTAIAVVKKIRAFRYPAKTGSKFHISVGHMTVMAKVTFFGAKELRELLEQAQPEAGGSGRGGGHPQLSLTGDEVRDIPSIGFIWDKDYAYQEELVGRDPASSAPGEGEEAVAEGGRRRPRWLVQYALLQLEQPVLCPVHSLIIGSRLDADSHSPTCRIGFFGTVVEAIRDEDLSRIRLYKEKVREGSIYRLGSRVGAADVYHDVTGQGLFKKETDISLFLGMKVETAKGETGVIDSAFGRTGKFKAVFRDGLHNPKINDKLYLRFHKYTFDTNKKMVQLDVARQSPLPTVTPPPPTVSPPEAPSRTHADKGDDQDALTEAVEATEESQSGHLPPPADFVQREGEVDVVKPGDLAIVRGLFAIEEDIRKYVGMRVEGEAGVEGCIVGPFGKGGKAKVQFNSTFGGAPGSKIILFIPSDFQP